MLVSFQGVVFTYSLQRRRGHVKTHTHTHTVNTKKIASQSFFGLVSFHLHVIYIIYFNLLLKYSTYGNKMGEVQYASFDKDSFDIMIEAYFSITPELNSFFRYI